MLLSLILATVLGSPAAAAPSAPGPTEDPPAAVQAVWYGGPAVACDVAAFPVALVGALATRNVIGTLPGLGLFTLAAPINHRLNHEPGRATASLVLRIAALAGSYAALSAISNGNCGGEQPRSDCNELFVLAFLGPPLVAMIVDDAFLARTTVPARSDAPGTSFSPALSVGTNSASLSLAGIF
ncbi:MAG TPA: hypothetical protein VFG23_01450 [Polyangia bacterium]|nr:hypothetical protein [Polyangia bacterium]